MCPADRYPLTLVGVVAFAAVVVSPVAAVFTAAPRPPVIPPPAVEQRDEPAPKVRTPEKLVLMVQVPGYEAARLADLGTEGDCARAAESARRQVPHGSKLWCEAVS